MSEELKPCPFCDSKNVKLCNYLESSFWGDCFHCGAQGSRRANGGVAVSVWNTRPSPWISVEDRLPEESKTCFIYLPSVNKHTAFKGFCDDLNNIWHTKLKSHARTNKVTHWMPIPELPSEPS